MRAKIECACPKCVGCCTRTPGWFAPGEAEKAAKHLGMPMREFERMYLARAVWYDCDHGDIYAWTPRNNSQLQGPSPVPESSMGNRRGRCVFLTDKDLCAIHPAKPIECALTLACKPDQKPRDGRQDREWIEQQWRKAGNPLARKEVLSGDESMSEKAKVKRAVETVGTSLGGI